MYDLTEEQTEYLGDAIGDTEAVVRRCIDLMKSSGLSATATWPDPRLTSTSERHCLQLTAGTGSHYGYGDTMELAAIDCFIHLWFKLVTVENSPEASEAEMALMAEGKYFTALENYMDRTGEDLRIARWRLRS